MTTIGRTFYPVQTSMEQIGRMQDRFAALQKQLATGQKASNLAEMGSTRYFSLSVRARANRISGYGESIDMVNLRLDAFNQVTTSLEKVAQSARTAITPSAFGSSAFSYGTVPSLARANLDQMVDLLNTDVNGRYLFSGAKTDQKPVQGTSAILDGAGGKAGFSQVAAERQQADVGNGLGRLTLTGATDTVTLTEDGAHPFGFKLSTVTSTGSAPVTLTQPNGTAPQSASIQFTGVPIAGQTVSVGLTLPDGSSDTVTLTAVTGTPGAGEFQIGADANSTAANFKTALQSSLTTEGGTTLAAASNNAAANNFFNAQGQQVMRVPGPNFATATSLVVADPTTTVIWYQGGNDTNARGSVQAKVDDNQTVSYGAQANEMGTLQMMRSFAVLAIQNFTTSDPTSEGRYDAIASRNADRMSPIQSGQQGSLELLAVELSNTKVAMADISTRHDAYVEQLNSMVSKVETVPDEQTAAELLALQTRLQASYQATSMISQLSLVNYIK